MLSGLRDLGLTTHSHTPAIKERRRTAALAERVQKERKRLLSPMSSTEPSMSTPSSSQSPRPFKALGQKVTQQIELEPIPLPEAIDVQFVSDEVTAVCPVTGQPDWYKVTINLGETATSIESKSLKLFLQSFRETGIFAEILAVYIRHAVLETVGNVAMSVIVEQKSRGGITLRATSYRHKYYPDVVRYGTTEGIARDYSMDP